MKLISLNLERCKHLDKNVPFLKREMPDVLCLQEVLRPDLEWLKQELGMEGSFAPMQLIHYECNRTGAPEESGVAILSSLPLSDQQTAYYYRPSEEMFLEDRHNKRATNAQVLLSANVREGQDIFRIATTHFTVTPDGHTNADQESDFAQLSTLLDEHPEIIFCGDMNAPRGINPLYAALAARYNDEIPPHYETSLDPDLHSVGSRINRMVDGLFTTREYAASDVRLVSGVSDHMAITATIVRR